MSTTPASEPPSHEIIVAQTPEERQQCYDVVRIDLSAHRTTSISLSPQRIEVFHREQKFPLETEIDELVLFPNLHSKTRH